MSAPIKEIGWIFRDDNKSLVVPIYSVDAVKLSRSQDWDVSGTGPQSAHVFAWKGGKPVSYDVNFKILVGWGKITTRDKLLQAIRAYHSMGSHRLKGTTVLAPPAVWVYMAGQIGMIGILESLDTCMEAPWGLAESDQSQLVGAACVFTGRFWMAPGFNGDGQIVTITNNTALSADAVLDKMYVSV